ncbi:MAG: transketolase [Planctomycetaceae bacterium]|nr:transketolase [Planctomycetaceae bacterium]
MGTTEAKAKEIRVNIIEMIGDLGIGHIGGCLSLAELLAVLYYEVMQVDPANPRWEGRDRLVCSKGHAGPALYAVLAMKGYFPRENLFTLNRSGTNYPSHCDRVRTPGIDMTTGSLGQGLSAAVGMAAGLKVKKNPATVYCIIGDGESQEGQIWEAAMFAAAQRLDNLVAFTDYNRMQIDGTTDEINSLDPLDERWSAFGWNVYGVDGHDVAELRQAIRAAKVTSGKPSMIVMNTIKGRGASFSEGKLGSHNMSVTKEMAAEAIAALQ